MSSMDGGSGASSAGRGRFATVRSAFAKLALLGAVVALVVVFVPSSGANLSGSLFEGNDGNLVVNTTGNLDWANVDPSFMDDMPSGTTDNSFGQGTKEDDPNVTIVQGSIPPNKNDLTRSYLATQTVGG